MGTDEGHLPLYGPGPIYVGVIIVLTVAVIVLSALGIIPAADARAAALALKVLGAVLAVGGIAMWVAAVKGARLDDHIEANHLVTTGVYAVVRNPVYSAFTFVCAGAILIYGNLWLLMLLPMFWAFLTALMRATEERWLRRLYGQEYIDYCGRVNRCIPWFPKR